MTDSRLSKLASASYAVANFAHSLLPIVLLSWILYFYSPPAEEGRAVLLSPVLIGMIRGFERVLGAAIEPIIGYLSDRTKSRLGRRLPWILVGAPLLCGSFVLIWFPPSGETDSPKVVVFFTAAIVMFWASYTAVVGPYLSLLPELATDEPGRVRLSVWLAVAEALSNVVGAVGAGLIIAQPAMDFLGLHLENGYQLLGVVFGLGGLVFYIPILLFVREPPRTPAHEIPFSFAEAIRVSWNNPSFLPYALGLSGFRAASSSAVMGIPFVATQLMGASEEVAGYMLGIIVVIAMVAFPFVLKLSNRFGSAQVFRWAGMSFIITLPLIGTIGLTPLSPMVHGIVLFVMAGFPVAGLMVLPRAILAEVIDIDHAHTQLRREAMYNGMSGVIEKGGEAVALAVVGYLFQTFGNSAEHALGLRLVGLAGGVFVALGLFAFRKYERTK